MATNERRLIQPGFWRLFRQVIIAARQEGIRIKITSTYRSPAQQRSLWEDFRRRLALYRAGEIDDPGLPAAVPGQSFHEVGLAIDVVTDPPDAIEVVGGIAEDLGLRWGIDFDDPVHFDAGNLISLRRARAHFNPRTLIAI